MTNNKWIDISQPLTNDMAHWPGDIPFSYDTTYSKKQTGSVNIGQITMSLHTGTHVDAPFHFNDNGEKIMDLALDVFIGIARVLDVSKYEQIDAQVLSQFDLKGINRLLLKTKVPNNPFVFPENIGCLTLDAVELLAGVGVELIGVDVPSVDPLDSKNMNVHHTLQEHSIHILENLMLDNVDAGDYQLVALPLPLAEGDGSPVRAVIQRVDQSKREERYYEE